MSPQTMPGVAEDGPIVMFAAAPGEDGKGAQEQVVAKNQRRSHSQLFV